MTINWWLVVFQLIKWNTIQQLLIILKILGQHGVRSNKLKDMTSTWYSTNDATFDITGVQLEVGSVVTPFEHRLILEENLRCSRYYQKICTW